MLLTNFNAIMMRSIKKLVRKMRKEALNAIEYKTSCVLVEVS